MTGYVFLKGGIGYSTAHNIERAGHTFATAKLLAAGGMAEARIYAGEWMDHYRPDFWFFAKPDRQAAIVENHAQDALGCAKRIVADGRAWYVKSYPNGERGLVLCTLIADGSAGPVGYDLWTTDVDALAHIA